MPCIYNFVAILLSFARHVAGIRCGSGISPHRGITDPRNPSRTSTVVATEGGNLRAAAPQDEAVARR
jgi:hypothetical protein